MDMRLPPSTPTPLNLRPDQQNLVDWFSREVPELGELYRAAVLMINEKEFPGRVRLICHACREIGNRLPGKICGEEFNNRVEYVQEMDNISSLWLKEQPPLGAPSLTNSTESVPQYNLNSNPTISCHLYSLIQNLIKDHIKGKVTNQQKAEKLIEAVAPENVGRPDVIKPTGKFLKETVRWFVGGSKGQTVKEDDLQAKFRNFENVLSLLAKDFYSLMDELDEILEETNTRFSG